MVPAGGALNAEDNPLLSSMGGAWTFHTPSPASSPPPGGPGRLDPPLPFQVGLPEAPSWPGAGAAATPPTSKPAAPA